MPEPNQKQQKKHKKLWFWDDVALNFDIFWLICWVNLTQNMIKYSSWIVWIAASNREVVTTQGTLGIIYICGKVCNVFSLDLFFENDTPWN